jgi:hypothetical protein
MARILEIQRKSNQYVANLNANIVKVIESKSNSEFMIQTNQKQFLQHKDSNDSPLIHKKTGSTNLSTAYAKKTGKSKPNFFESGDFFDQMLFTMPNMNEYFITSKSSTGKFLSSNYGDIYGISPKNQPLVQQKNSKAIIDDYFKSIME